MPFPRTFKWTGIKIWFPSNSFLFNNWATASPLRTVNKGEEGWIEEYKERRLWIGRESWLGTESRLKGEE